MSEKISVKNADINKRYVITEAAGVYWLYDPGQSPLKYVKPLPLNEFGAEITKRWIMGESEDAIIESIASGEDDPETVRKDLESFFANLHEQGY